MSRTRWNVLAILFTALLGAGLFLAYDASKHTESRYDVSITLEFISELTNLLPGVIIWTAVVAIIIWRGLRVEALVLLMAAVTSLKTETLGAPSGSASPIPTADSRVL